MTETASQAAKPQKPTPPRLAAEVQRLFEQANERQKTGDQAGAIELYNQLIERYPGLPDAYNNLAVVLKATKKIPAAVACLRRAVQLAPRSAGAHSNLGNVLWMALEFEESMAHFQEALRLDATRPEIYHNLGLLHFSLGDYAAAIDCFDRSLAIRPEARLVRWDRALALLASGDLARGFAAYDERFDLDDPSMGFDRKLRSVRSIKLPLWRGEDIAGRTLWIYSEQGYGDTLQFCRFIPLVARRGARVIFDCPPELLRLMGNFPGVAELRKEGSAPPQADYHLPLMSLVDRLAVTRDTIPADVPYLTPPPVVSAPRLTRPAGTRFAAGIVWAGRPQHANDHNRSLTLDLLLSLCDLPGLSLYSLQMGPRVRDIADLSVQAVVRDLSPQIRDFADTARFIQQLDVVITIDSAVAHLAGALGRSTAVLLAYTPDWRWMGARGERTPWYPTLRLFRQQSPGDWKGVVKRLHDTLARTIAQRK